MSEYRDKVRRDLNEAGWTIRQVFLKIGLPIFALLLLLGWAAQGNEFFMYKVFAPRQEAVRREVFENSKAYNQGMIQELQNMQFEYVKADKEHQAALGSIILHRAADYNMDDSRVPADLRNFVNGLRQKQMNPSSGGSEIGKEVK